MLIRHRFAGLSEEELNQHLENGQSDQVAFVAANANQRAMAETLAALANANGGLVLFSVSARGVPQKNSDLAALREAVIEATLLTDPPLILPTPQIVTSSKGAVVVAQVPPGLPHLY